MGLEFGVVGFHRYANFLLPHVGGVVCEYLEETDSARFMSPHIGV